MDWYNKNHCDGCTWNNHKNDWSSAYIYAKSPLSICMFGLNNGSPCYLLQHQSHQINQNDIK